MSDKKEIRTPLAPAPVGPYVQACRQGEMVFISGQIPLDPKTGQIIGANVAEQTAVVLTHLKNILDVIEGTLSHIVKTTVYLTNLDHFDQMNAVYARAFNFNPPARATVEVSRLPKGALVEIDAIALVPVRRAAGMGIGLGLGGGSSQAGGE